MFDLEGVRVLAGQWPILDSVSAVVPDGCLTAITGPNGAGKQTLLQVLARTTAISSGSVLLEGCDLRYWPDKKFALRCAMAAPERCLQQCGIHQTVADLVRTGRNCRLACLATPCDDDTVATALELAGVADLAARSLETLSATQRRFVCVARAIAQLESDVPASRFLLVPCPTEGLDREGQQRFLRIAGALATRGIATVYTVTESSLALRHADHVIALRAARVVAQGSARQVRKLLGTHPPLPTSGWSHAFRASFPQLPTFHHSSDTGELPCVP